MKNRFVQKIACPRSHRSAHASAALCSFLLLSVHMHSGALAQHKCGNVFGQAWPIYNQYNMQHTPVTSADVVCQARPAGRRRTFSKVASIVALYSECTRALTCQNFRSARGAAPGQRRPVHAFSLFSIFSDILTPLRKPRAARTALRRHLRLAPLSA